MRVPAVDPSRHLPLAELERQLSELAPAASKTGRVALLVARPSGDHRTTPKRVQLSQSRGLSGDRWGNADAARSDDQITAIQSSVARVLANGQDLTLFGDNLFLDLDLTEANLPAGTRLRVGEATLEVTPEPHDGCRNFRARFGADALRLVSRRTPTRRNLRGIHLKVIEDGHVCIGDEVQVLRA